MSFTTPQADKKNEKISNNFPTDGREQYDWKSNPFSENVARSVVAYKQMFDKH